MRTLPAFALLLSAACSLGPEQREGEPDGSAEGEGEGESEPDGHADGEGEGEGLGEGEGEGEGEEPGQGPPIHTVLLIGNSQLGLGEYDCNVAEALEKLSIEVDGVAGLLVDRVQVNGQDCAGFLAQGTRPGTPQERAGSGDYDLVILVPAIFEPQEGSLACFDTFRTIAEDAGARFGLMASAQLENQFPAGFQYMHDAIGQYARDHGLLFIPGGDAWVRIVGAQAPRSATHFLYSPDYGHPGMEGSYIYVLSLWAAIRQTSTIGLPRDLLPLRCDPNAPCLDLESLEACIATASCGNQNGVQRDAAGHVSVITVDEAEAYQMAVDEARAAL